MVDSSKQTVLGPDLVHWQQWVGSGFSLTHHRGQAHAMLAGTTVKPPQLDEFFAAGEADLRAADFAALGWTESMIWDDGVAPPPT